MKNDLHHSFPGIPLEDKNTNLLLYWLQDEYIRQVIIGEFLLARRMKCEDYFLKHKEPVFDSNELLFKF